MTAALFILSHTSLYSNPSGEVTWGLVMLVAMLIGGYDNPGTRYGSFATLKFLTSRYAQS